MPDNPRWSRCNNNKNKVHSKCSVLELSPDHPPSPRSMEELFCMELDPGARKVGDCYCMLPIVEYPDSVFLVLLMKFRCGVLLNSVSVGSVSHLDSVVAFFTGLFVRIVNRVISKLVVN